MNWRTHKLEILLNVRLTQHKRACCVNAVVVATVPLDMQLAQHCLGMHTAFDG
jgi:hypothetical protein